MERLAEKFKTIETLHTVSIDQINTLKKLGITNLGDLLSYQPFRYARYVQAAKLGLLRKDEVLSYLNESAKKKSIEEILLSSVEALRDVGRETAASLKTLGVNTIKDLAKFEAFEEAEELITSQTAEENDPFAPACVLPKCKKFTRNSKTYVSFFRQTEIRELSQISKSNSLISSLFNFSPKENKIIYLGYSTTYLQEWIYKGVHLGEPQGSVNLFMGQDTQVSVLDWRRTMRALRTENTGISENLVSSLFHQRAVDEVARATAEEHQHGSTSSFGANAATAGSFVAAGALVGGVGGGISGALAGLVIGNAANVAGGAPTIGGAIAGSAVGSVAGAAAGSLIFSGAMALGFVESDAEGTREIFAKSAQNIQQRTVQNSSSLRSFWSNIVSQNVQEEQQRIQTDRVTNYNKIHALNAMYFEVLNEYQIAIRLNDVVPIIFIPFKPIFFNREILKSYWWIIRTKLTDASVVLALDQHFTSLESDPSPAPNPLLLPQIQDIQSQRIEIEVNLDGSAMESLIGALAVGLVSPLYAIFLGLFDASKRENVKVSIVTTAGTVNLQRDNSPNLDPNFVGRYFTTSPIPIHTIQAVRIRNDNSEFRIRALGVEIDLTELAFEKIEGSIRIRNRSSFTSALPNIGSLENKRTIRSSTLFVASNNSQSISWDVGDRLRDQFEGVNQLRDSIEDELSSAALTQFKISNLLNFINANKFSFTRLILQNTETEQVISVLEELKIGDVNLSEIAITTPIGIFGNHFVLPLKKYVQSNADHLPLTLDTIKLKLTLMDYDLIHSLNNQDTLDFFKSFRDSLSQHLQAYAQEAKTELDKELIKLIQIPKQKLDIMINSFNLMINRPAQLVQAAVNAAKFDIGQNVSDILFFIDSPLKMNASDSKILFDYYGEVLKDLKPKIGELIGEAEVSLPSPAIFMEPVLSNAKGAELYDMRRNSHYDILQAPGISSTDPNIIRAQDVNLSPTIPGSSLEIQSPPNLPLPNSLAAALAEAGKLDLTPLINANAGVLTSTLSNLSSMATELAKASAKLTGDAQKEALSKAGDVAKQVTELVSKSIQTPTGAPPAPKPGPPKGQKEKAEVVREIDRINRSKNSKAQKQEKKETIGAPIVKDDKFDYQMSILFLDQDNIPYPKGTFILDMSFFELGKTYSINGGAPIEMEKGQFFFPDLFQLKAGRMAVLSIEAEFNGVLIRGLREFTLPAKSDIVFKCKVLSETHRIKQVDVKSGMDEIIQNSNFSVSLNLMLQQFLNAGIAFPFKIFKVNAETGSKSELDLKGEYQKGTTSTNSSTSSTLEETEFEIVIPKNGWEITIH